MSQLGNIQLGNCQLGADAGPTFYITIDQHITLAPFRETIMQHLPRIGQSARGKFLFPISGIASTLPRITSAMVVSLIYGVVSKQHLPRIGQAATGGTYYNGEITQEVP